MLVSLVLPFSLHNSSVLEQRSETLKSSLLTEVKGASLFPPFKIQIHPPAEKVGGHVEMGWRHHHIQVVQSLGEQQKITIGNLNAVLHVLPPTVITVLEFD